MGFGEFFSKYASALFALIGALGGGMLSFIGAMALKRREFNLSLKGKLLDRRIIAHEKIITLANEMRIMCLLGNVDENNEAKRAPRIMLSFENFNDWLSRFTTVHMETTTWLSTGTKREVNLVQDYLLTLHLYLEQVSNEHYPKLGALIRQDFIDLSSSLEKAAFTFFQRGILSLNLGNLNEWHKYERVETERRLQSTILVKSYDKFIAAKDRETISNNNSATHKYD